MIAAFVTRRGFALSWNIACTIRCVRDWSRTSTSIRIGGAGGRFDRAPGQGFALFKPKVQVKSSRRGRRSHDKAGRGGAVPGAGSSAQSMNCSLASSA